MLIYSSISSNLLETTSPRISALWASVIDSSTWVVQGSDSSVAVETNTAGLPVNQSWVRAPGNHRTHAENLLKTKRHINTRIHTQAFFHVLHIFDGYMSVRVLKCICVHVCVLHVWWGLLLRVFLGSCHGRVLTGLVHRHAHTHIHTNTSAHGSACIKRPNKQISAHHQPNTDKTSRHELRVLQEEMCVCGGNIFHLLKQKVGSVWRDHTGEALKHHFILQMTFWPFLGV